MMSAYGIASEDAPEREEEILFPARLGKVARADGWLRIHSMLNDPELDHVGLVLRALWGEVGRAEAAEQRCRWLENGLRETNDALAILTARVEALESERESFEDGCERLMGMSDPYVHPLFETRSIRPVA